MTAASTTTADDLVQLLIDLDSHWREGKALADRLTRLLDVEDERGAEIKRLRIIEADRRLRDAR